MKNSKHKDSKLSLVSIYAGGIKRRLARSSWLGENRMLVFLVITLILCILGLVLNHKYGHYLGDLGRDLVRELIVASLVASTVGLFYELFARKSMVEELLKIVKQRLKREDQTVERLTKLIRENQRISESGLVDMDVSRGYLHEDIPKALRSAKEIRVLAVHGARLWVNTDLRQAILGKLTLRVLLMHPHSSHVTMRATEYPDEYDANAIQAQIVSAIRLLQKWTERKGERCQIRLYDEPASLWLVFVDDIVYVSSYSKNRSSQDSEIYKFRKQKHSMFYVFHNYFERLWETAQRSEEWDGFAREPKTKEQGGRNLK